MSQRLERQLGVPIVPTEGHKRRGIDAVKAKLAEVAQQPAPPRVSPFAEEFQAEVAALRETHLGTNGQAPPPRYLCERMLLDTGAAICLREGLPGIEPATIELCNRRPPTARRGRPAGARVSRRWPVTAGRAKWCRGPFERPSESAPTWSDRVDRLLTHKVLGLTIFAAGHAAHVRGGVCHRRHVLHGPAR